jgi:hypothetical protein
MLSLVSSDVPVTLYAVDFDLPQASGGATVPLLLGVISMTFQRSKLHGARPVVKSVQHTNSKPSQVQMIERGCFISRLSTIHSRYYNAHQTVLVVSLPLSS